RFCGSRHERSHRSFRLLPAQLIEPCGELVNTFVQRILRGTGCSTGDMPRLGVEFRLCARLDLGVEPLAESKARSPRSQLGCLAGLWLDPFDAPGERRVHGDHSFRSTDAPLAPTIGYGDSAGHGSGQHLITAKR